MLLTYWRVHLLYTIPATVLLSLFINPLLSKRNIVTISFHVAIAIVYTFPWDSYIIHNHAWTYPDWAVMYTIKKVPIEEVFFFAIQSTFTAQLFILLGLFDTPSQHLRYNTSTLPRKFARWSPMLLLPAACVTGWKFAVPETHGFYLGCITWWITPITAFLWFIAGDHVLSRWKTSFFSILLPTAYLCTVDTIALRAGTWHITERTSTGIFVFPDLPLEEFVFFVVTNTLLVCGMNAFDRAFAVIDDFGDLLASSASGQPNKLPAQLSWTEFALFLLKSLTINLDRLPASYEARIPAFESTQKVLAVHSRSFHTASYIFPSAVRRDLVVLYAFCRVLDDFCDESATKEEARQLIDMSKEYLDLLYPPSSATSTALAPPFAPVPSHFSVSAFLYKRVPKDAQSAFFLLSTICTRIPRYPFDDLIAGYEWDLNGSSRPIVTEADLVEYSRLVASSVAEMCVWAMWANESDSGSIKTEDERKAVLAKAAKDEDTAENGTNGYAVHARQDTDDDNELLDEIESELGPNKHSQLQPPRYSAAANEEESLGESENTALFLFHANFITASVGISTILLLWLPIPILHWIGWEEFGLPRTVGELLAVMGVCFGGVIFNAGFMILLATWGPVVTSVGNLFTLILVAASDEVIALLNGYSSLSLSTLAGSGLILVAFGMLITGPGHGNEAKKPVRTSFEASDRRQPAEAPS